MEKEEIPFSALDFLQMTSDLVDSRKKKSRLSVKCPLVEDGLFKCQMSLRDFCISEIIEADTELEAKFICADNFWKNIFKFHNVLSEIGNSFRFLKEKKLVTNKPRLVSSFKKDGFSEKHVEVDSELFMKAKVTFKAVGFSQDKRLAVLFGELCLLSQINDYFMFSPLGKWNTREIFEINCKGMMNETTPSDEFFDKFPQIRNNVFQMLDGRMICLLCKQVNRTRSFALHHHTKLRKKLYNLHYCIITSDVKLASAVNRNLAVLMMDQNSIAKFVSEYKYMVLDSARDTLGKHIPDLKLCLFGQSEEGMGQCYYILNISVSSSLKNQQLLDAMLLSLSDDSEHFEKIKDDFNDAYPNVKASHLDTGLDCIFHVKVESSIELSKFLKRCGELSPEVATLSTLFNFWSSYCKLDLPDSGYLQQTVFPLMVIYFLQHAVTPPRFPNLHLDQFISRKNPPSSDNADSSETFDTQLGLLFDRARGDLGNLPPVHIWKLWLLLLQFYLIDFNYFHKISLQLKAGGCGALLPQVRDELDKDYARLTVANPLRGRTSNLSFSMKTHNAQLYYFDCFHHTLDYYHSEVDHSLVSEVDQHLNEIQLMYPSYINKNRDIGICQETIVTDILPTHRTDPEVRSVEELAGETRTEESPDLSKGLSINIDSFETLESTATTIDSSKEVTGISEELSNVSLLSEEVSNKPQIKSESNDSGSNSEEEGNNPAATGSPEAEDRDDTPSSASVPEVLLTPLRYALIDCMQDNTLEPLRNMEVSEEEIERERNCKNFIRTQFTPICGLCREKGHTKEKCPKEVLPEVKPVRVPGRDSIRELNEGLLQLVDSHKMSVKETERRELLRQRLELDIRSFVNWKFDLCLFGSSINKFGNDESDVDLCLVLQPLVGELPLDEVLTSQEMEHPDPEYMLKRKKLDRMARELSTRAEYNNSVIIIPAKVPLIRFTYTLADKNYICDISISNSLALNNSRLLATYACFDQRVQDLGLLVKHFGKVKDLADASLGGLSSYAYILLTIHFLQRTDPPIIPVLQQIRPPGYEETSLMVGEWECYFCDNIKAVKQTWKHKHNNQNLAELWLEFLCYCVSKFNWDKYVISLRQLEPIPKVDKEWTNRKIAIEDPFNLKHNLGTVLSFRNAIKLRKCFIQAREFYHKPRNVIDYLDWLVFTVKPRIVKPPTSPVEHPDPNDYHFEVSSSTETILLSWSQSLESYCTQRNEPSCTDFDIKELSHTVLIPSSDARAAVSSQPQVTTPSDVIKYISLGEDILLLSGINPHSVTSRSSSESHINGVIASPLDQQKVLPSEPKDPPPEQSKESDSLSLEELTQRVAQASLEIIQPRSVIHSPPYNQILSTQPDTAKNKDTTLSSNQEQHLSKSSPLPSQVSRGQDKDTAASLVAQNQSPIGTNIPHGAKGLQLQTSSPGFKVGRGSSRTQLFRHEEISPPVQYNPQMQQETSVRARGAQSGRNRGQHRPPRRVNTDQVIEEIFYPATNQRQREYQPESYFHSRGAGRSARGRGRAGTSSSSHRKPPFN